MFSLVQRCPHSLGALTDLIPPKLFSTFRSPIVLPAWLLTCFNKSRFAGMTFARVSLSVGSEMVAYPCSMRLNQHHCRLMTPLHAPTGQDCVVVRSLFAVCQLRCSSDMAEIRVLTTLRLLNAFKAVRDWEAIMYFAE